MFIIDVSMGFKYTSMKNRASGKGCLEYPSRNQYFLDPTCKIRIHAIALKKNPTVEHFLLMLCPSHINQFRSVGVCKHALFDKLFK